MPPEPNSLTHFLLTSSATLECDSSARAVGADGELPHKRSRPTATAARAGNSKYRFMWLVPLLECRACQSQVGVVLVLEADVDLARQLPSAADVLVLRQAYLARVAVLVDEHLETDQLA